MTTTLNSLVTELSKQLDDWKEFTASSGSTNTIVSNAIAQEQDTSVSSGSSGKTPSTVYVKTDAGGASAAPEGEERNVASKSTTTITTNSTYVFTAAIAAGDIVEVHKAFSRYKKEQAIKYACMRGLPDVYKEIAYKGLVFGDYLINGGFVPKWSQTTYPDNWVLSGATASKYTYRSPYDYAVKFAASGNAGSLYQSTTENTDLWTLAGKTVNMYAKVFTSGTSEVRLSLYDGTTTTYSDYHPGDSTYRTLNVEATIATNPSSVKATVLYDTSNSDAYVTDIHLVATDKYSYDISYLGINKHTPSCIYYLIGVDVDEDNPTSNPVKVLIPGEDWYIGPNGMIHFNEAYSNGIRMEIVGMAPLTTPVSTYGGGTAVSTEIDDINREGQIIIAEAAAKLHFDKMNSAPNKDRTGYEASYQYWKQQAREMRSKYGMKKLIQT